MNLIEAAVAPLKADAIERATQAFDAHVERVLAHMEACGWDLDVAFPRANSRMSRSDYMIAQGKHGFAASLTRSASNGCRSFKDPNIRYRADDRIAQARQGVQEATAASYDAFVAKLVGKVGEVESAEIDGNHVWGRSTLTVRKAAGKVERWKTQMIVNVSSLGKVFNQWPTRLAR